MSDSVRPHRRQPTRPRRPWDSPGKTTGVGCHFLLQCMKVKSESEGTQSCPTLSDPMDCSLTGSSVHGIFQARVLEWGAIAFSDKARYLDPFLPMHLHGWKIRDIYQDKAGFGNSRIGWKRGGRSSWFCFTGLNMICPLNKEVEMSSRWLVIHIQNSGRDLSQRISLYRWFWSHGPNGSPWKARVHREEGSQTEVGALEHSNIWWSERVLKTPKATAKKWGTHTETHVHGVPQKGSF